MLSVISSDSVFSVKVRWSFLLIILAGITVGSVIEVSGESGGLDLARMTEYLHLTGYMVLCLSVLLVVAVYTRVDFPILSAAVSVTVGYSLIVEAIQYGIPYRTFSIYDIYLNIAGVVAAISIYLVISPYID